MSVLFIIAGFLIAALAIGGWIYTESMKVSKGYPLVGPDGNMVGPADSEAVERLVAENKALRDQLETVYDRIETLERIVTDKPSRLAAEIDALDSLPPRPSKTEGDA